jgi:hypothetical protein
MQNPKPPLILLSFIFLILNTEGEERGSLMTLRMS